MWVVAAGALGEPGHKVEVGGAVELEGVAVKGVEEQSQVAVGGELISDELAVLPNANHVGEQQDSDALVLLVGGRGCEVGVVLAGDPDCLASGVAPSVALSAVSGRPGLD